MCSGYPIPKLAIGFAQIRRVALEASGGSSSPKPLLRAMASNEADGLMSYRVDDEATKWTGCPVDLLAACVTAAVSRFIFRASTARLNWIKRHLVTSLPPAAETDGRTDRQGDKSSGCRLKHTHGESKREPL